MSRTDRLSLLDLPSRRPWAGTTAVLGIILLAMWASSPPPLLLILVCSAFMLLAGPQVVGCLDSSLTIVMVCATVAGTVGAMVELNAPAMLAGGPLKLFGLAIAAKTCAVACLLARPRRYGLAFGAGMLVLSILAAFYDPLTFSAGLSGSIGGFCFGLTINAIEGSLRGVTWWPRRQTIEAPRLAEKTIWVILLSVLTAGNAHAQELEARAFSPAPIGTKIFVAGIGGQTGAILFDSSLHIEDVAADLTIGITAAGYTFGLGGRQARILGVFPMAWGHIDGQIASTPQRQNLNGMVDPRIKLSIGLRGAPALTRSAFAKAPRRTMIGAAVTVMPPLGVYHEDQLINLGYHRWGIKPEIAVSRTIQKWTIEGSTGVWFHTKNTHFFPGTAVKEQDAIGSLQGHVSYALPRRSWVALDATYFGGGQSRVNGIESPDLQRNSRLGGTLSIMTFNNQSLKITVNTGSTTRRGTDFDTINVVWQAVVF